MRRFFVCVQFTNQEKGRDTDSIVIFGNNNEQPKFE